MAAPFVARHGSRGSSTGLVGLDLRRPEWRGGSPLRWLPSVRVRRLYSEPDVDCEDFVAAGAAFDEECGRTAVGGVGIGAARLLPQRALVDFGVHWLVRHRTPEGLVIPNSQ